MAIYVVAVKNDRATIYFSHDHLEDDDYEHPEIGRYKYTVENLRDWVFQKESGDGRQEEHIEYFVRNSTFTGKRTYFWIKKREHDFTNPAPTITGEVQSSVRSLD